MVFGAKRKKRGVGVEIMEACYMLEHRRGIKKKGGFDKTEEKRKRFNPNSPLKRKERDSRVGGKGRGYAVCRSTSREKSWEKKVSKHGSGVPVKEKTTCSSQKREKNHPPPCDPNWGRNFQKKNSHEEKKRVTLSPGGGKRAGEKGRPSTRD